MKTVAKKARVLEIQKWKNWKKMKSKDVLLETKVKIIHTLVYQLLCTDAKVGGQ